MRAAIMERTDLHQRTVLFFGCRRRDSDYLYEWEWRERRLCVEGAAPSCVAAVIAAFSRDQEEKEYVTHKILAHGALVWSLINEVYKSNITFLAM